MEVYPRECGATRSSIVNCQQEMGLSPRVRGNRSGLSWRTQGIFRGALSGTRARFLRQFPELPLLGGRCRQDNAYGQRDSHNQYCVGK